MIKKDSPIPLYHQLAEILQSDIRDGLYQPGDKIPSENVLAEQYKIGRPTVRQAIECLIRKQMLIRRRGSGTYVAELVEEVDLFSLAGTIASFKKSKKSPQVRLLTQPELITVTAGPDNPFAERRAYFVSRQTTVKKSPVLVEDIYLHPDIFPGFDQIELGNRSLSQLVMDQYHFTLAGGTQHFSIGYPDKRLSKLLDLPKTSPILAVRRFLHSHLQQNAIYSDLYCRTDKFIFTQSLGGFTHG